MDPQKLAPRAHFVGHKNHQKVHFSEDFFTVNFDLFVTQKSRFYTTNTHKRENDRFFAIKMSEKMTLQTHKFSPPRCSKKVTLVTFFWYFCPIPYPKIVVFKCKTQVFINRKNVAKKRDFPDFLTIFCCTFLIKNTLVFLFCVFYF